MKFKLIKQKPIKIKRGDNMDSTVIYPALVYKNNRSNIYVANCIMKKLIGYGHNEKDAITNLENMLNQAKTEFEIKIKPVYQLLPELGDISKA